MALSRLLIFIMLIILVGCEAGPSIKENSVQEPAAMNITYPAASSVIGRTAAANLTVTGSCPTSGKTVSLVSGSQTVTAICNNNSWQAYIDFSSASDGSYQLLASDGDQSFAMSFSIQTQVARIVFTKPTFPVDIFGDSLSVSWNAVGDVRDTNGFLVEAFANSTCTGSAFASSSQSSKTYTVFGLIAGTTYSVRVTGYNPDDVAGTPVCSQSFTPFDLAPTFTVKDVQTLQTTHARQTAVTVAIATSSAAKKWCLSETQFSTPASTNSCFRSTKPTTHTLTTGDGTKTVYLWVQDIYGTVLLNNESQNIILDTVKPGIPSVVITDPNTSSTTETLQALNDLAIGNDSDVTAWCVIESSPVTVTTPAYNSSCFNSVEPTSITLTQRGNRRAYVFTRDAAFNVSPQGFGAIEWLRAVQLDVVTLNPLNFSSGCVPFEITLYDKYGNETPAGPLLYGLGFTISGSGKVYGDAKCASQISSSSIAAGVSRRRLYYNSSVVESASLTFSVSGTTFPSASVTIDIINGAMAAPSARSQNCQINDGGLQCWGLNNGTGFGSGLSEESDVLLQTGRKVNGANIGMISVSTGFDHACASNQGMITCWGQNDSGQLGNNTTTADRSPVAVTIANAFFRDISASDRFTCGVNGNAAVCWGNNDYGQLGDGTNIRKLVPTGVTGLNTGVTKIVTAPGYACAIYNDTLRCWGRNHKGQLGNGASPTDSNLPIVVTGLTADVTDVSIDENWGCAVMANNLYCWGTNTESGGLGDGSTTSSDTPVQITSSDDVTAVAVGKAHACMVRSDTLYCWGRNDSGQFGNGSVAGSSTPVTTPTSVGLTDVAAVVAKQNTTCRVTSAGAVTCWGSDANNMLGTGRFIDGASPTAITGFTGTPDTITVGKTNCVKMTDGTVQCWGSGEFGQIGDGNTIDQASPTTAPTSASVQVSSGEYSTCSVSSSIIRCWGTNLNLRLGQPSTVEVSTGANVQGIPANATGISVSESGSHACAIVDGGVMCWGNANDYKLGIPFANTNEESATYVLNIGGSSGATKVVAGRAHTCALVNDTVQCWGDNSLYQIGNGVTSSTHIPYITVGANAVDIATGGDYTCAVLNTGELQCWGLVPQFGSQTMPTTHTDLNTNVSKVSAGAYHACVIMTDNTVKCFGTRTSGRLGDGATSPDTSSSVVVTGLSNTTAIAASMSHTCAIDSGNVYCWGANVFGAMGDGTAFAVSTPTAATLAP